MSCPIRPWFYSLICLPLLTPIAATADADAMTRVLRDVPRLEKFQFCNGGTCADVKTTNIREGEWQEVVDLFSTIDKTAEAERQAIAEAIGLIESIIGPKTGTDTDKGGTFGNSAYPGQLDCNDEATNTTTYLRLMAQHDLLHFHKIEDTTTRGGFLIFGRHSSAVIRDLEDESLYAVDSWFYDNGKPAVVLPLETWLGGWRPANSKAH